MQRYSLFIVILLSLVSSPLLAGDFDWINSLSISASKNDSGYRTRLALRFHLGDAELKTVIRDSGGRADAYMVLRLAEISKQPRAQVIRQYRRYKGKSWGKLAKSLGIKPGSREFHALKRGHDLGDWNRRNDKKSTPKHKERSGMSKHGSNKGPSHHGNNKRPF